MCCERDNTAAVIDAGGDVTIDEGSWFIGLGSFVDPENTRVADNNGLSFEVAVSFPGPFDITGPSSPAIIEFPTVTWQASAGATSYDLVISSNADLSLPVQTFDGITDTSQLLGAIANGIYYVGVTAENEFGLSTDAINNGYSFTVAVPGPGPSDITGPLSHVAIENPTVTWEASTGAAFYDLIVSSAADCSVPVQEFLSLDITSQVLDPLNNGDYYVCVTAADGSGRATDTTNDGFSFTIAAIFPQLQANLGLSPATQFDGDLNHRKGFSRVPPLRAILYGRISAR